MPVVTAPVEPTHEVGGTLFTSLATPSARQPAYQRLAGRAAAPARIPRRTS